MSFDRGKQITLERCDYGKAWYSTPTKMDGISQLYARNTIPYDTHIKNEREQRRNGKYRTEVKYHGAWIDVTTIALLLHSGS